MREDELGAEGDHSAGAGRPWWLQQLPLTVQWPSDDVQ